LVLVSLAGCGRLRLWRVGGRSAFMAVVVRAVRACRTVVGFGVGMGRHNRHMDAAVCARARCRGAGSSAANGRSARRSPPSEVVESVGKGVVGTRAPQVVRWCNQMKPL
jgi:hypothetical protein